MKALLVITLEVDGTDDVLEAVLHVAQQPLPHFAGGVRLVHDDLADEVTGWLDSVL